MIRSTADKDAKQKALADMQARRAKLAARQAQLDDDEHIDSASAGADDALADALGSLTLKKGAPNAPPTTHLPGTSAPPPTAPLADDQFDFDFSSTDEDDYEPRDDATTGASDTDSQDEADTTDEEDVVELPPRAQPEGRHSGSAAKSAEESASSGVECVADTESEGQAGSEEEDEDVFEVSPSAQSDGVKSRAAVTTAAPVTDDWLLTHKDERFQLTHSVHTMLYTHQVAAVQWLWGLWVQRKGGLLADDMGLGKTLTCASLLAGLFKGKAIRRAIVVAPKTLLAQWKLELSKVGLRWQTQEYGGTPRQRETALDNVQRRRGVLLTTYGMITSQHEELSRRPRRTAFDADEDDDIPYWDVFIVDEGHKIKNPATQIYKALSGIPAHMRVLISGTPIQNNFMELHALYEYCCPGLLGDRTHFKRQFANKIADSQEGAALAAEVRDTIAPFFLRRTKANVMGPGTGSSLSAEAGEEAVSTSNSAPTMPPKNDFIIWLKMHPFQRRLYEAFLLSDRVKAALNEEGSALTAITVLKKICDHPALLKPETARLAATAGTREARKAQLYLRGGGRGGPKAPTKRRQLAVLNSESDDDESDGGACDSDDGSDFDGEAVEEDEDGSSAQALLGADAAKHLVQDWGDSDAATKLLAEMDKRSITASCKTVFIMQLLGLLQRQGHRTLIFSQSLVMLGIIEAALRAAGTRFLRIDGSVTSADTRLSIVNEFQNNDDIPVFLLSAKVGGLGLTITAADRVIIADPAWNPATDNQSVDRAYRIGQTRPVVVYRLITCGTVEEKIYRRQVFKSTLAKVGLEESSPVAHFSNQQLVDLFAVVPAELENSVTAQQLRQEQDAVATYDESTASHLSALLKAPFVVNTSDHSLLSHGKANGGTRKAVWSGGSSVSSLLDRVGRAGPPAAPPLSPRSKLEQQAKNLAQEVESLRATAVRTGRMLPDGGARLRASIENKVREMEGARAAAAAYTAPAPANAPASAPAAGLADDSDRLRVNRQPRVPAELQRAPAVLASHVPAAATAPAFTAASPATFYGAVAPKSSKAGTASTGEPVPSKGTKMVARALAAPAPARSADLGLDDLAGILGGMQLGRQPENAAPAPAAPGPGHPNKPAPPLRQLPMRAQGGVAVVPVQAGFGAPEVTAAESVIDAELVRGSSVCSDDSFVSAASDMAAGGGSGTSGRTATPAASLPVSESRGGSTGRQGSAVSRRAEHPLQRPHAGDASSDSTPAPPAASARAPLLPQTAATAAQTPMSSVHRGQSGRSGGGQENHAALVSERAALKASLNAMQAQLKETPGLRSEYRQLYERYEEVKKGLVLTSR